MGISLRHHVISLVAVFLMLMVGLLVGVGLSSQPELTRHIDSLTEQFDTLMTENRALTEDAARQERFTAAALPRLVGGRLAGRQVALIVTARPPDDRTASQITEALEAAGATVPYRLAVRADFADRAVALFGRPDSPEEGTTRAARQVAAAVARGTQKGLREVERLRLVRLDGRPAGAAPFGVIFLGGAETEADVAVEYIDRPMAEGLLAAGVRRMVGCQTREALPYTDTYRDLGLSTVDNADLVRGRLSVVYALSGKPGHYGDGPFRQEFAPLE